MSTNVQHEQFIDFTREKYPDLLRSDNSYNLDSPAAKQFLSDYQEPTAFQKVGYARPLGGFFYQFFYAIIGAVISTVFYGILLGVLFPYPESRSMEGMAGVLFVLIQTIFNIPTAYALETFVAENRIKDPFKMVQYIRFYIWYQMMTGIVLVTGFSIYVLYILQEGSLMWAKWLMLIIISREFPAMTGVFITIIRALQKFDTESKLNFIIFYINNNFTKWAFAAWGRFGLGQDPQIGEMLGIAIGIAIGGSVVELINMFMTGAVMSSVLKPMGFTLRDLMIPHIDHEIIWKSLKFGIIVSIPGVFGSVTGLWTTLLWYNNVPAYMTFTVLSGLADELANIIKAGGGINIFGTISEAGNNNKRELTSYYISMIFKFVFFFKFAIGAILISFMPLIIEIILMTGGAQEYVLAIAFVTPNIIATVFEQPNSSADVVIIANKRPMFTTILNIVGGLAGLFLTWFLLAYLRLPDKYGITAIIWIMPLGGLPVSVASLIIKWVYIHKNIAPVRIKQFAWQSFIAPIVPAIIITGVAWLWYHFVFYSMLTAFGGGTFGNLLAAVISILFAFLVCAMFLFFPLYCFFGGWDDNTMAIFDEAVRISGPSRFIFLPINKASHWLVKFSPWHNKFPIPYEAALKEAGDLMQERHIKDRIVKEILAIQPNIG